MLVLVPFPVLCAMGFKGFDEGSELVSLYLQLSLSPSGLLHGLSMVLSCVSVGIIELSSEKFRFLATQELS